MLEDYNNVMPPFKPMGDKDDEEPKVLKRCFGSIMIWLENQIHLGTGSTTPQITRPVGSGPSSHVVADPNPGMQMAQDRNNDDDDVNIDTYINTAYCDDLNDIEEPVAGPSEKRPTINKRLSFHSQETPPDVACTEPQKHVRIFTPNTLHKWANE
jgi:hypothetical protein